MDLTSKLRAIVKPAAAAPRPRAPEARRELTYEPDDGRRYEAVLDLETAASALGGRLVRNGFGQCVVIDRRYESDRWHGDVQIGDCEPVDAGMLRLLDPAFSSGREQPSDTGDASADAMTGAADRGARAVFLDLETTGLSGGAGTVAFLVGCGYFDWGAFHVRQFLLTSYRAERALLAAAAELVGEADLIVTYNGKTFDLPVMETRWAFHRMRPPFDDVPHFDMLHPARRLWRSRSEEEEGCRLSTLERLLFNLRRVGDVDGFEIPGRFFRFLRTADPRPLEPVLEHNRLDLVSLAAVTGRAVHLARGGEAACRDGIEALAVGRMLERAGEAARAEACYRRAIQSSCLLTRAEALYRLGLRCRRARRFEEAAGCWRELLSIVDGPAGRHARLPQGLRQFAFEALAIHQEHRLRDLDAARELARGALEADGTSRRADGMRYRLARLERKLAKKNDAQLFES